MTIATPCQRLRETRIPEMARAPGMAMGEQHATGRWSRPGLRKTTVHDARHTYASLLADLDVHPRVAMAVLRHARFSVTMEIYTQISTKATREALKRLGDALDEDA